MKPNPRFLHQSLKFWANVRSVSEKVGYTSRKKATQGQVKTLTLDELLKALKALNLGTSHIIENDGTITAFGCLVLEYFEYRADILNTYVESRLMNVDQARKLFEELQKKHNPRCPIPMNKQKKEKRTPAYFTSIINILIEANIKGASCNYDPGRLTTITRNGEPLRTLARRVDGAFPSVVNPIALWEIKEYYYTTTFGSRVADGVYETLLDGMELQELWEHEKVKVKHYMMIDAHYTWWVKGRSYLCRLIDMLHMGYVDEVLFGSEVVERLPLLVHEWISDARQENI